MILYTPINYTIYVTEFPSNDTAGDLGKLDM